MKVDKHQILKFKADSGPVWAVSQEPYSNFFLSILSKV